MTPARVPPGRRAKRWFIVPDLHGNARLARNLLMTAGVPLLRDARRDAGIVCVQLGDIANCVARSRDADLETLELAGAAARPARGGAFDVVLVGNHELPYFGGQPFAGFFPFPEVREGLRALERRDVLRACLLPWPADVLLTHAGVAPEWGFLSAVDAAEAIDAAWTARLAGCDHALLSQVGRARGGRAPYGGVLWSDFREELRAPFKQIHGHTPLRHGPLMRDWRTVNLLEPEARLPPELPFSALNLDTGVGKGANLIVGAWLDGDGAIELVECRA